MEEDLELEDLELEVDLELEDLELEVDLVLEEVWGELWRTPWEECPDLILLLMSKDKKLYII